MKATGGRTGLSLQGLHKSYGALSVTRDLSFELDAGAALGIIGPNGAGKSTLFNLLTGVVRADAGRIVFDGHDISRLNASARARLGVCRAHQVPQPFARMSVYENLLMGAASARSGHWTLDTVYALFPTLRDKRHAPSHALSGGQQQQVAIGRGLMSNPQVLLCDEISLGLSPAVVRSIYEQLPTITAHGTGVVLVEQNIALVLQQAQYVYVLREGRMVLEGAPASLNHSAISQAYFGVSA